MIPERQLLASIHEALNRIEGVRVWRCSSGVDLARGVRYGLGVGCADLIGMVDGKFLGIEVKSATGRLSADQRRWQDAVNRLGGIARVVRSVDEALQVVGEARGVARLRAARDS